MKTTVLIIDDEESIRYTFKTFLEEDGYAVLTAESLSAAADVIQGQLPDIIFSDIILGRDSGLEILRIAKERALECPVIMITGQPTVQTAAESVRQGAYDYMIKPIRKDLLLRIAHTAARHKRLLDEKRQIQAENDRHRRHLDAIFRSVQDAIITVDNDMRVVAGNPAVQTICGSEPEPMIGKPFEHLEIPCLTVCREVLRETLAGKTLQDLKVEYRQADQTRRVLEVSCSPLLDSSRQAIGATLVIRDITRITELEGQLTQQSRFTEIIGHSAPMQRIYTLIEALADTDATVLISGESGTGKNLVARALHQHSSRAPQQMLTVNCSALAENLLESELFGHVKGAFTGAVNNKMGRFEACHRGSLFLDEVGEISPRIQVKLLKVLQEKELERVGESTPIKVDVRVIAATNRRLKEEVSLGRFREDLYYRLKVVQIELPPLRQRPEDIPLLVNHFCRLFGSRYGKSIRGLADEVLQRFLSYPWPGNVRELEHAIEHAYVLCNDRLITWAHIPSELSEKSRRPEQVRAASADETVAELRRTLSATDGNKAKAARLLGISRQTLYRRLRKYRQLMETQPPGRDG